MGYRNIDHCVKKYCLDTACPIHIDWCMDFGCGHQYGTTGNTSAAVSTSLGTTKFSYFIYLEKDLVQIVGLAKLTGEAVRNVK